MSYCRLSKTEAFSVSFTGHKVWYDEASQALVLLRRGEFRAVSMHSTGGGNERTGGGTAGRRRGEVFLRFRFDGSALDVKLSPCCRFAAVQRSEHEIEIISTTTTTTTTTGSSSSSSTLACTGRGNAILRGGVVWLRNTASASLVLVTTGGLQVFQSTRATTVFAQHSVLAMFRLRYFWSLPSTQMLVVQTEDGEMRPFSLVQRSGGSSSSIVVDKWAKFSVTEDGGPLPDQGEAALVGMYDSTWFVHIRKQEMILYELRSSMNTRRVKSVQSFPGSTIGLSCIDSLLLAHSQQSRVSLLFDALSQDSTVPGECFVSPLPVDCTGSAQEEEEEEEQTLPIAPYATSWVFLPPYWVLDARLGKVWKLELNLRQVCETYNAGGTVSLPNDRLVRFLLRRMRGAGGGGQVEVDALDCVFAHLLHRSEMRQLAHALPWLRALAEHSEPMPSVKRTPVDVLLTQNQVCELLFDRIGQQPRSLRDESLAATMAIEYARLVAAAGNHSAPPGERLFLCIAQALLRAGRWQELYQFCLLQILPPLSAPVVGQVLCDGEFRGSAPERQQVAMDAVFRLQDCKRTLCMLLEQDEDASSCFTQAVRWAKKHSAELLGGVDVVRLLLRACRLDVQRLRMVHNLLRVSRPEWLDQSMLAQHKDLVALLPDDNGILAAFGVGGGGVMCV